MKKFLTIAATILVFSAGGGFAQTQSGNENTDTNAPKVDENSVRKPELTETEKAKVEAELANNLLARLKAAENSEIAETIEQAIWQLWLRHPSPSVDVLMGQAIKAMNANENKKALRILTTVIELAPEYAEGWNKRATVYFYEGEYKRSLADIAQVLDIEPRHFGALSGLGLIHQAMDNKKEALEALRRALKVHPFLDGAKEAEKRLKQEVEGEPI